MALLIGTAPNQIPTNGDLGTMAFQDSAAISVGTLTTSGVITSTVATGTAPFTVTSTTQVANLNAATAGTAANVTGIVAVANGGSGTATPSLVAGTNVTVTGTWPNQTIAASGGGGGSATLTISNKTAAYTVIAGDLGTVINCTSGTFTVSLTAAATLGSGFNVTIWNMSSGSNDAVTIDPNGAETIDGKTTLILRRGEGMQIVCDGTNWQTGNKKVMRGYAENISVAQSRPSASGDLSIAIGPGASATGSTSLVLGFDASATSTSGSSIGSNSGANGSRVVTGSGAMALGGSYASGTDSFAAGIGNNTSTYGAKAANAIAMGYQSTATLQSGIAIGYLNTASNSYATAIGGNGCTASGQSSFATGENTIAAQRGKFVFGAGQSGVLQQGGFLVLRNFTSDATPKALYAGGTTDGAQQVIVPNESAYAFTGIVVARQSAAGGTASAAWKVEGLIRREANAGTTTLVFSSVTAISNVPSWTLALSADTTNGCLAITATGAAATNIRWVATIQTSEVTYA